MSGRGQRSIIRSHHHCPCIIFQQPSLNATIAAERLEAPPSTWAIRQVNVPRSTGSIIQSVELASGFWRSRLVRRMAKCVKQRAATPSAVLFPQ